jgi:hypothetical protein
MERRAAAVALGSVDGRGRVVQTFRCQVVVAPARSVVRGALVQPLARAAAWCKQHPPTWPCSPNERGGPEALWAARSLPPHPICLVAA